MFEHVGNLHIHSRHSDGTAEVPEIARDAARAGCDFILMNDHAHMAGGLHLDEAGYYGRVLVLIGQEIGHRYHHYLAYNLNDWIPGHADGPQTTIDRVKAQGGIGFLAHPFEKGMPFRDGGIAYTWNDLTVRDFTGICIWNFSSRWKERVKDIPTALYCLLFKALSLKGPSEETLAYYDRCCLERRVTAIGGSDAHGSFFRLGLLRFRPFSYRRLLRSIDVHLLLDAPLSQDVDTAALQIYGALQNGSLYVAHDGLKTAKGFRFAFVPDEGDPLPMGAEAAFRPGNLQINLPRPSLVRIIRNGRLLQERTLLDAHLPIPGPGVYRIEACLRCPLFGLRPWIFSNPIYLRAPSPDR
ncbi:PHP domain protein [uncultured Desulfatiglans sp.]|nr:PHP domain protein [uncultured Desulfatiglans sp.]